MKQAMVGLCLGISACHAAPTSEGAQRREAIATSARPRDEGPSLYERGVFERAAQAVLGRLGASTGILMIEVFPERARFEVESTKPGEVVEYEWRHNGVRGPTPLELKGKGSLQQNLFLASSLEFGSLPGLVELARARVDSEQGTVSRVLIRRNLPLDDSVGIRVYVDSPLKSSHVDADARGKPVEPGKYP
ncbi:MAG TPA: hypothetical protein VFQ35_09510 [Polyangiaceae bacterium]|nr:hypothetical protein [Polyangiaceae bacterium]